MRTLSLVAVKSLFLALLFIPTFALAQTTTNTVGTGSFVPLTHFPQIESLAQSNGFAGFVNTLYKICIGAGAVLAVIMIMVAGVQFMTSRGSVASNEKAKAHIQNALLGLLLVLAPTIVFGIINPDILHLDLGNEFSGLKQNAVNPSAFSSPASSTSGTSGNASYLLAGYVIFTNTSTNGSCYVSLVQAYPTQSACTTAKNAASAAFGQKDGWSRSNPTFVKSCDLGDPAFNLVAPNNVPQCTS